MQRVDWQVVCVGIAIGASLMLAKAWCAENEAEVARLRSQVFSLRMDLEQLRLAASRCNLGAEVLR